MNKKNKINKGNDGYKTLKHTVLLRNKKPLGSRNPVASPNIDIQYVQSGFNCRTNLADQREQTAAKQLLLKR